VAIECIAAVLFVSDFLTEQIEGIKDNSTLVETYQRTKGRQLGVMGHIKEIFGDNMLLWPLPFPTYRTPDYLEPAIPEDENGPSYPCGQDDNDQLNIAGDDTECCGETELTGVKKDEASARQRR
jgi:hypothetical protein